MKKIIVLILVFMNKCFASSVLILWLTAGMVAYSQTQTVKGVVTDKDSEYPIPDAEVIVTRHSDGKTYGAVTDFDGQYHIPGIPIGKVDVSVKYMGYEGQSKRNLDLLAGKELTVNFSLSEKINSLNAVVIQANTRKNVEYTVASNYTMKAEQVNRYAGTLGDISRMAMNYAGVTGNNDTRNDIIVRGNNPGSLLWEMEGVPIPNPNHYSTVGSSGGPVNMININLLGKADFLTGAFPANFGNTTSAAFNLGFRTPNADKYEFLGQLGFAGAELGVEGPVSKSKNISWMANYRYSTLELFDKLGFNLGLGTAVPEYQDASFLVNAPVGKKQDKLRLWGIAGKSHIQFINEQGNNDDNLYVDFQSTDLQNDNYSVISGLNYTHFLNERMRLYTTFSFSRIFQKVNIDTLDTDTGIYRNYYRHEIYSDYATGKMEWKNKINKQNTVSAGAEYTQIRTDMDMQLRRTDLVYDNNLNKTNGLLGVYAMWKYRFSDHITLNTGIRGQYFDLNRQIVPEPRLGFTYKNGTHTKYFLAYGLHSNIHSVIAYYSRQRIAEDSEEREYHNLGLKMMRSHHIVGGFETSLGTHWQIKTELYYQFLFDVPVYRDGDTTYSIINSGYTDPGGSQLYFNKLYNDGKGRNYGIDLTVEYPLENGFYLLYTGSLSSSEFLPYDGIWRHTAWDSGYMSKISSGKEFVISERSTLAVNTDISYAGGRRYTPIDKQASIIAGEAVYDNTHAFEEKFPDYFRMDLNVSYRRSGKKITQEWQLDLRNLTNRKNVFSTRYDPTNQEITRTYQAGFLPVMQYRILF